MKRFMALGITAVSLFVLSSFVFEGEAQAAVVQVRMTADVTVPYLVGRPPRPIVSPRRITMHVHREGVSHTRVFGLSHHHHSGHHSGIIRVGYRAPRFQVRTRLTPIHAKHPHFTVGHSSRHWDHDDDHRHGGRVKIKVKGPGHIGHHGRGGIGLHGKGGHGRPGHHGKPGGKVGGKLKFKGKF